MLFNATNHRLTSKTWFYKKCPVDFSNEDAIESRLHEINATREFCFHKTDKIVNGDIVYAQVRFSVATRSRPRYIEILLRLRRKHEVFDLAYGNAIVEIETKKAVKGFACFRTKEFSFMAKCNFDQGNSEMSGKYDGGCFTWTRRESANCNESLPGEVVARENNIMSLLELIFPSRMQEGYPLCPTVIVRKDEIIQGEIARSLNPVFRKGYRVSLWLKGEVPIFYASDSFMLSGSYANLLIIGIFGAWFCYQPIVNVP